MYIRPFRDKTPRISPAAYLAENAVVTGDVTLGDRVSVWYGAVLRGDVGPIEVGESCNIQDNCVLHCGWDRPTVLGRNIVVGHGAILHSCRVEDGCLIGMGATVMDDSVIGAGSIVGAGALVPPGKIIPPRSLVLGIPGRVVRAVTDREVAETLCNAETYVELAGEQLERYSFSGGRLP